MKKYISSILLMLVMQQINAATFYEQLCNFNFNWKKYAHRAPLGEERRFNSDIDYVQAHLSCVLSVLRSNPVNHLNALQSGSRKHLIELLDAYRNAGQFPVNYYIHQRIPVFIDEHQTHCAVAFLLQQTGHEDMALRIADAYNYAWLKDIHDGEFPVWQQSSGLSLEELKLIQGAYDYYMPNALIVENKYEVPQKPACMTVYFENKYTGRSLDKTPGNIWCKGEGNNGVLNGSWVQNYAVGMPWITGFFENGKRTGPWQEFYQGTRQLCRTENWRNDKLNGIRKRYDRSGQLIEEILFKDGNAIVKTNYDRKDSLVWVRKPFDSNLVSTEAYTFGGALLASGHERVYNPGNLLWFQNIELTALNSAAITSRDVMLNSSRNIDIRSGFNPHRGRINLYNTPPLVEYKKEGEWKYYKEYDANAGNNKLSNAVEAMFVNNYRHFSSMLFQSVRMFEDLKINGCYDSLQVVYEDNNLQKFYGYGSLDYTHLQVRYYHGNNSIEMAGMGFLSGNYFNGTEFVPSYVIKEFGQYNKLNQRIGRWQHFDRKGNLYKTENFIIAWKEEDEEE